LSGAAGRIESAFQTRVAVTIGGVASAPVNLTVTP
jgi:hypothetical protein